MNLLYPVVREPKPAEPLQDGTFRILAEPSNCIKSPRKRQDFSHPGRGFVWRLTAPQVADPDPRGLWA